MSKPMEGRVCLVTGGASGVGLAVARGLALQGATLILLCRNRERGLNVKEQLSVATGNARIGLVSADLAENASVRAAAASVLKVHPGLHVLVCCAGALYPRRRQNSRGVELTFATEVLGHFLLTSLLRERLAACAPARVVTAVGNPGLLRRWPVDFEDLQLEKRYGIVRAKLQAAVGKTLFTLELARRLQGSGVTANAFHPGLVRSHLLRYMPGALRVPLQGGMSLVGRQSPTGVYAASAPELADTSGAFLARRRTLPFPDRLEDSALLWSELEALAETP